MIFSADGGFVINDFFYPTKFRYSPRRNETKLYIKYMSNMGYTVRYINGYFEGGDIIFNKKHLYILIGYDKRTTLSGASDFKNKIIQDNNIQNIILLKLIYPYFYHLRYLYENN